MDEAEKQERLRALADAFPLANTDAPSREPGEPCTFDYTRRYWGHDYMISQVVDGGQTLHLGVFGREFRVGDYLIIQNKDQSTRYRITEITDHPMDPGDLWFVIAEFAPRQEAERGQ